MFLEDLCDTHLAVNTGHTHALSYLMIPSAVGGEDGGSGSLGDKGAGEEREARKKRAGSGSSKMAGCGSEMQNATR